MLQLKNNTPFATSFAMFPNEDAIDTLYIIVRATFNIASKWTLTDNQQVPVEKDLYWDKPGNSSIKMASDFHIGKPATDIIMNGHACAPEGKQATQLDVSLKVGLVNKTVRVFGDRVWNDGKISSPKPFTHMPVKYERAYGGEYKIDDNIISANLYNPVGTGFAGERKGHEMEGLSLPNIEDPASLISSIKDSPVPVGFGALSPAWQPRSNYAGTYDEEWEKTRAPYLPGDFDKRFLNMAHPALVYPGFLQGGEPVDIINMHPQGNVHFTIPVINLSSTVAINKRTESPKFNLETVVIEPDTLELGMVWKAALKCDKEVLKIKQLTVNLSR